MKYEEFLSGKAKHGSDSGFDPVWMPDCAFDFQRSLIEWSVRKGRAAIFADCGLGKSLMSLAWAENVVRKTNKPVLLLAPLAVSQQFVGEGAKFGIDVRRQRDHGGTYGANVLVTNYEQLHHFSPNDFAGLVCDESSILKNFDGKIKGQVTEFARQIPYRLCCTATAAPNDFHELGTTSEALGYLGHRDMLTMFFKEDSAEDFLGWGRKTYRFRGYSSQPFWRWVCSWARSCRKPSDLGFDDGRFVLPPLVEREHVLETSTPRPGMLFSTPARDMREQRDERRATMEERCGVVASIVANHAAACKESPSSVVWCHLDPEAAQLLRAIPGAVEVSGSMRDEKKEERLTAFARGEIQTLVTKPKIGCYGLNWQHCCSVVTFPSHSFEQYYQAVRRCWRFGQTRPVTATVVTTEGEVGVLANLQRKARQSEEMFSQLVANMNNELKVSSVDQFSQKERLPKWL